MAEEKVHAATGGSTPADKNAATSSGFTPNPPAPGTEGNKAGAPPAPSANSKENKPDAAGDPSSDPLVTRQPNAVAEAHADANRTPTERKIAEEKANKGITVSGRAGGAFNIDGQGFGTAKGSVTIAGRLVDTTAWRDDSIKGQLPSDVPNGDVIVHTPYGYHKGTFTGGK